MNESINQAFLERLIHRIRVNFKAVIYQVVDKNHTIASQNNINQLHHEFYQEI